MADHEESLMACEEKQEEKVASILQVNWLHILSKKCLFHILCFVLHQASSVMPQCSLKILENKMYHRL